HRRGNSLAPARRDARAHLDHRVAPGVDGARRRRDFRPRRRPHRGTGHARRADPPRRAVRRAPQEAAARGRARGLLGHSSRSATSGSTRTARYAGTAQASRPMRTSVTAVPTYVVGSTGATLNNSVLITVAPASAAASPP